MVMLSPLQISRKVIKDAAKCGVSVEMGSSRLTPRNPLRANLVLSMCECGEEDHDWLMRPRIEKLVSAMSENETYLVYVSIDLGPALKIPCETCDSSNTTRVCVYVSIGKSDK